MALRPVLTAVAALLTVASAEEGPRDNPITPGWPCPIDTEITPCVCSQDALYNLYMDCSLAKSEEQLEAIFNTVFPFTDFYELKIVHDPEDWNNVIDEINGHTFADLSFQRVIITGTQLKGIMNEAFSNSHSTLTYFDLTNNQLESFPSESLALYTSLRTLIVDDNKLPELYDLESDSLEVFSANRNSNMTVNGTNHFTKVPNLRELYLSEIALTELKTGLFFNQTKLEVIDLSKNYLTELSPLSVSTPQRTLKSLNFKLNEIRKIWHDALRGLTENATLNLASNSLSVLEKEHWEHIFKQITRRAAIDLDENDLVCGCDVEWLFSNYECEYLCRLTDTTQCLSNNEQLIFLDVTLVCVQCDMETCPPQLDCTSGTPPSTFPQECLWTS